MTDSIELYRLSRVCKEFSLARTAIGRLLNSRKAVAVDDVDLVISQGDSLGIVGESGSGKTTLARLMVGLAAPTSGTVCYRGQDLQQMTKQATADFHKRVQMVFQSTHTSLNPRKTVRRTLTEAQARERPFALDELLDMTRLSADLLDRRPHELSGGQRQRVGIARAIAQRPELIIADEPTSALDVSLQSEIIDLLQDLHRHAGLTLVVISHDLAMVGTLCQRTAVMCRGVLVEEGESDQVLLAPTHAYTRRLIEAIPKGLAGRSTSGTPFEHVL